MRSRRLKTEAREFGNTDIMYTVPFLMTYEDILDKTSHLLRGGLL